MKITIRGHDVLPGVLLGALAGFLLTKLGLDGILPTAPSAPSLVLTFVVIGAFCVTARARAIATLVNAVLLVLFVVVAFTPIMRPIVTRWVRDDSRTGNYSAVVVLSSNVSSNGTIDQHGLERLLTGIAVATRDSVRLITTRIVERPARELVSSDSGQAEIVRMSAAIPVWTTVDTVHSTRDEAVRTAALLGRNAHVAVVTSPLHTRRACAVFEKTGLTVSCIPAREHGIVASNPRNANDRLEAFREFAYEILASVEYRVRGWI